MGDLLSLAGVCKHFRGFELKNITFSLPQGYIMGLVGPNGSGKTTTIRLILNMLKKDKGAISVAGFDSESGEIAVKEQIGYVCDDNLFLDEWKTGDVKAVLSSFYKTFDPKAFNRYLHDFELPGNRKIKDFSKGMKTKLMLAAALSRETRLLLLDEPTSGLDPVVRAQLLDILQEYIVGSGRSVLFSTHITTDLEKVADYITFLSRGSLVFSDDKDSVLERYRVIKGGGDALPPVHDRLIGVRGGKFGFEGLIDAGDAHGLPDGILCENATLDEIVVYHTLGVKS